MGHLFKALTFAISVEIEVNLITIYSNIYIYMIFYFSHVEYFDLKIYLDLTLLISSQDGIEVSIIVIVILSLKMGK